MEILTPGHKYAVANFEDPTKGQTIQFIEKEPGKIDPNSLVTVNDGTTNEEVLGVLIDRMGFLMNKLPSRETALAITKLEEAMMWLNRRTQVRIMRGVEGTHKP